MKYRFYFRCPRCLKETTYVTNDYDNAPLKTLKCGDCLMSSTEVIALQWYRTALCRDDPKLS
jgi:transcription elongation factor Elf1